ncbi:MAG TPA: hypothetical protein DDW84_01405 [Phycisphaerales bacterium]|nr:MAG: hypothetical protein A2Y13_01200 [Planctomycetes bacterium GWC2_45_44]HBG77493.1 hypothetical protein [Phycisphaerales bacterium]HBR19101.1 hypothetical protein [Phycisphaerales bacterium]
MTQSLGIYDPIFYAQEALIQLEKALGMAGRVHRGYDAERKAFGKGQTVSIRKPSTFTAENAPSSAQDLETESVDITLDQWKEVKFSLTDKELAWSDERIISEHIRPAAIALADNIDQALCAKYKDIPWYYDLANNGSTALSDITGVYKVLFDNKVPVSDIGNLHYMVDGNLQLGLQGLTAFNQAATAGQAGLETLMRGSLGTKFGMEIFANQNVPLHTGGVCADVAGALNANAAKGATSIVVKSITNGGTFKAGDSLVITGDTQRYAITADATVDTTVTLSITPPLKAAALADAVVDLRIDTHRANLAFHRNAFALATAPLSEMGAELGAKIATITDPITGLAIRSRIFYVGDSSAVKVALDILYGVKTLDPNLACRGCGQS